MLFYTDLKRRTQINVREEVFEDIWVEEGGGSGRLGKTA